ncbi:MAG TPA: hypothetical protein DE179_07690 [Oceanospirillaceae bacterium]|nr:hypothetical protein [Oceanospirillaceae bacterium]
MSATLSLLAYTLLSLIHLFSADQSDAIRRATKPLLMPLLWLSYVILGGDSNWVNLALLAAWLGDVALLNPSKRSFVTGLVSFLFGHLAMAMAIFTLIPLSAPMPWPSIIAGKVAIALGIFWYLRPHLGNLKIPVLIYCLVLASKGIVAIALALHLGGMWAWILAAGALLFMASDLTLAINRFVTALPRPHLWVMSTYTLAQGMIVVSLLQLS